MRDIKTEKGRKINRKTLIVAFDIAQEKHMVYFRCPDGREEKPFVVFNKREEYEQMWERIILNRHHTLKYSPVESNQCLNGFFVANYSN